jgi:hypothetical protein
VKDRPPEWQKLRVRWFRDWSPELDQGLRALPEMPRCPHELFQLVARNRTPLPKIMALVTDAGEPVAVAALRARRGHWESITEDGISPRNVMPAREGYLFPVLKALRKEVMVASWDAGEPPREWASNPWSAPVYKIDLRSDFEAHWRRPGPLHQALNRGRKRTQGFTFEVDSPGSVEWVIGAWTEQWAGHPDQETITAGDRLLAAQYLQARGLMHAFVLRDGERPVAGRITAVVGDDLVDLVVARDKEYEHRYVGHRSLDLVTHWAAQAGFARFDLGGFHQHKSQWAPQDGVRWMFSVSPAHLRARRRAESLARTGLRPLRRLISAARPAG